MDRNAFNESFSNGYPNFKTLETDPVGPDLIGISFQSQNLVNDTKTMDKPY
jgi:hypothetical protein